MSAIKPEKFIENLYLKQGVTVRCTKFAVQLVSAGIQQSLNGEFCLTLESPHSLPFIPGLGVVDHQWNREVPTEVPGTEEFIQLRLTGEVKVIFYGTRHEVTKDLLKAFTNIYTPN